MRAIEQKKYCGIIQNKIQEKYNVFLNATSTGETLWAKKEQFEALKNSDLKFTKAGVFYCLMVNKSTMKALNIS